MLRRRQRNAVDNVDVVDDPAAPDSPLAADVAPHLGNPCLAACADAVQRNDPATVVAVYDSSTTWDERLAIVSLLAETDEGRCALDA